MGTSIRQPRRSGRAAGPPVRVSLPAPAVEPSAFLAAAGDLRPRGYWRRGGAWSAWCGSAARVEVGGAPAGGAPGGRFARVAAEVASLRAADHPADEAPAGSDRDPGPPRVFGGFAFHSNPGREGSWRGFPAARFDLPAFELRGGGPEGTRLLVAVASGARDGDGPSSARREALGRGKELLARLREGSAAGPGPGRESGAASGSRPGREGPLPAVAGRELPVSREAWCRMVEAALAAIREGRFRKVVLARPVDVRLEAAPDPLALLRRLVGRQEEGGFPFLLEPSPGTVFVGASPELVAVREGGRFHAMAVAGTAPRSEDPAVDERLGRGLLESAKDRSEHAIGVRDMRERLAALGADPDVDESPHLLRLRGIQHLRTDLSVRAAEGRTVLDLLRAMHPTAAVSGYPREPAAAFLREREGFERGWYAGPVGWLDADGDGVFAPALRCAVVQGDRARLFAGAGIVEGSDPGREWEETAMKLGPALEILGAPPGAGDGPAA